MPTINLTDKFGVDVNAVPAETSALLKYFQQLPSLRFDSLDLSKVGGLTLDQPAVTSLSTGLTFLEPVNLVDRVPALSVGAGAKASFALITKVSDVPGHDDTVEMPNDTCYVSFGIEARALAQVSVTSGALQFGAAPSTGLELVSCSRFPLHKGVTLLEALRQTISNLAIPAKSADLADLPAGQIALVRAKGKLTVSGTANLLAVTNPLATASLPAPLPAPSVSAGGSVTVGVSCSIEADYEVIARKLESGAVRLGWYHGKGTEVVVSAAASEGITAGFGTTDLFSTIIGAISGSPKVDLAELASAGVPDSQATDIQLAVKAATARKLEIAVGARISASALQGATFLYDIVPASLTVESRAAVDQALRGDLTGIHAAGLAGVSPVHSVWDDVRARGLELNVNLLGILNYRSIATLALEGKVLYEPATGALVISDTASAERIRSTQVNFGADTDKLRHVLAESFLITAAYRGSKQFTGEPALQCSHCFFDLQSTTSRSDMARKLRSGAALGLLVGADAVLPAGVANFGRTLFSESTDYDDGMVERMFLDTNDSPLPLDIYETAGRNAIQLLIQEGDEDDVRRRPAIEDALWSRMKDVGQPGFGNLFPGVPAPLLGAITADYSTIQWWADAMSGTAQQLAKVRLWLAQNSGATLDNPMFQELRQDLAKHLRQVAATTREEFGEPWGLIAMNQLVGRAGGAKILITGPLLVRDQRRALAAGTGLG